MDATPFSQVTAEVVEITRAVVRELLDKSSAVNKANFFERFNTVMVQRHYMVLANPKDLFKEFNLSVDLVGWKPSLATAVAIMADEGFGEDRIVSLDQFHPNLHFPQNPVVKLFINLNSNEGLIFPKDPRQAIQYGPLPGGKGSHTVPASSNEVDDGNPF